MVMENDELIKKYEALKEKNIDYIGRQNNRERMRNENTALALLYIENEKEFLKQYAKKSDYSSNASAVYGFLYNNVSDNLDEKVVYKHIRKHLGMYEFQFIFDVIFWGFVTIGIIIAISLIMVEVFHHG